MTNHIRLWLPLLAGLAAATAVSIGPSQSAAPARPNILVIVADDLGYSDIGAFGGEIATPNLDALARRGALLTDFHTAPTCSPTRAMLLTGADNHEVGLGTMAEARNALPPAARGRPGYEGSLTERAPTIAARLRRAGYMTVMAGKWHLGLTEETSPAARGFDRSFAMLQAGHDHFGDDQKKLYAELGAASTYRENGQLTMYPVGRYSADVFADRMIGYLREAKAARKPFFAYLTFTQPHWPLQAPAADIARYKGRYDAGYEDLRARRLARMKTMGLVAAEVEPHPFVGVRPWAELSASDRAISARKMEIYAAMVDRMDRNIGRVVAALKANGQYDNTLIVFLSDNGAEGSVLDGPIGDRGPVKPELVGLDNSLANLGHRNSFAAYGPGWAQAATAPSRLAKGSVTEGGVRTPAIAAGPGVVRGQTIGALLHVADITPTALAAAGVAQDLTPSSLPIRGRSWGDLLAGRAKAARGPQDVIGWELFYGRALRQGDWKAVYAPPFAFGAPVRTEAEWRLFDLKSDPGEVHDLAAREPGRLQALVAAWDAYAAETGVFVPPRPTTSP